MVMASVAVSRIVSPRMQATRSRPERQRGVLNGTTDAVPGADLAQPEIGAVVAWASTALASNPIGAVIVHDACHIAATVHTYRREPDLPPELNGYAERGSGTACIALAGVWVLVAGVLVYPERRRLFPSWTR
jgi:hypothetical protein